MKKSNKSVQIFHSPLVAFGIAHYPKDGMPRYRWIGFTADTDEVKVNIRAQLGSSAPSAYLMFPEEFKLVFRDMERNEDYLVPFLDLIPPPEAK